jgi:hypothetical protein
MDTTEIEMTDDTPDQPEKATGRKQRSIPVDEARFDQRIFFQLIREHLHLNYNQIAAKIGISPHYLGHFTSGRNHIRLATVLTWFDALGLDEFDLVKFLQQSRPKAKPPMRALPFPKQKAEPEDS